MPRKKWTRRSTIKKAAANVGYEPVVSSQWTNPPLNYSIAQYLEMLESHISQANNCLMNIKEQLGR